MQSPQIKLALTMVAALDLIWRVQPTVSEWSGKKIRLQYPKLN